MQSVGRLLVNVITSRAQIPVAGATVVVVRRTEGGKYELLSLQETDSSGEVRPVDIAAPAQGESTAPGMPDPFAVCDVWAEHPGFAVLMVAGVQIFPGQETLQTMVLSPLSEGQTSLGSTQRRDTPAQDL